MSKNENSTRCESHIDRLAYERRAGMESQCRKPAKYVVTVTAYGTEFKLCKVHAIQARRANRTNTARAL